MKNTLSLTSINRLRIEQRSARYEQDSEVIRNQIIDPLHRNTNVNQVEVCEFLAPPQAVIESANLVFQQVSHTQQTLDELIRMIELYTKSQQFAHLEHLQDDED